MTLDAHGWKNDVEDHVFTVISHLKAKTGINTRSEIKMRLELGDSIGEQIVLISHERETRELVLDFMQVKRNNVYSS